MKKAKVIPIQQQWPRAECVTCAHWDEKTSRTDDSRWGICLESPPTVVATVDEDDGSPTVECVLPWTEMPFGCGRHAPHKPLMQ